jgi:protein-S-isoprenylcysteine O-methyltransferase Ste14
MKGASEMHERVLGIVATAAVWGSMVLIVVFNHQFDAGAIARGAGLVLVGGGATLLVLAGLGLGGAISGSFAPKALVTTGVYGRVKHPMYLGGALSLAGLGLYLESAVGICATVVLAWPGYWLSAAVEDRRLRERYGARYDAYRKRTWM